MVKRNYSGYIFSFFLYDAVYLWALCSFKRIKTLKGYVKRLFSTFWCILMEMSGLFYNLAWNSKL